MTESSGYKEYVAGTLAGVATVITGHPFDTVKVKLQKHNAEVSGLKCRNGLHCAARILKTEGVWVFDLGRVKIKVCTGEPLLLLLAWHLRLHSCLAFIPRPSNLYREEYKAVGHNLKMQVQVTDSVVPKSSRYSSPLDCAIKTVKTEGLQAELSQQKHLIDLSIGVITGSLGGVAFWSAVLPLDVAKTIIQTSPDNSSTQNPFRVLNSIYRRAGLRGCYAGLGPTIVRAFPANAAAIVTWELAMKALGIRHD